MKAIVVCLTEISDRITNLDMQLKRESFLPYTIRNCEVAGMRFYRLQYIKHIVFLPQIAYRIQMQATQAICPRAAFAAKQQIFFAIWHLPTEKRIKGVSSANYRAMDANRKIKYITCHPRRNQDSSQPIRQTSPALVESPLHGEGVNPGHLR